MKKEAGTIFCIVVLIIFSLIQDYKIIRLEEEINKIEKINSVQSGLLLGNND